jgi:hypothetical protein
MFILNIHKKSTISILITINMQSKLISYECQHSFDSIRFQGIGYHAIYIKIVGDSFQNIFCTRITDQHSYYKC